MSVTLSEPVVREDAVEQFIRGYITAALWSEHGEDRAGYEFLDEVFDSSDINAENLAQERAACLTFFAANYDDLQSYVDELPRREDCTNWGRAGHDFWLTRNGHGVGFWDRGLGALGDKLSDAARKTGERHLYVGDDGELYFG